MTFHSSSEGMFAKDVIETPEFKAGYRVDALKGEIAKLKGESLGEGERAQSVQEVIRLRGDLLDLMSQMPEDTDKLEYQKLIIECDEVLPEEERTVEI